MHRQPLRPFPTHDLSHERAIDPGAPVGNGQIYIEAAFWADIIGTCISAEHDQLEEE